MVQNLVLCNWQSDSRISCYGFSHLWKGDTPESLIDGCRHFQALAS